MQKSDAVEDREQPEALAERLFSEAADLDAAGRAEEALDLYLRALDRYRSVDGTEQQRAYCLHNAAVILRETGRYDDAVKHGQQALELLAALPGSEDEQVTCLNSIGIALDEAGRY